MSPIKHIAVVIACAGACQAFTQEPQPDPRTISVTGTAVTQVKPDYAVVEMEAFYRAWTAVVGEEEVRRRHGPRDRQNGVAAHGQDLSQQILEGHG